ncbi:hypothetical protein [Noviherbaspirillum pedocola]|uniref:Uncharacterized protein n=1 Tax=Noviherbaspirillum pedocola TaxID=2801341 RepID=A0A934T1X6_9BURK|nr:hypothetical protein [Noviherbaspirillum pedocola]MBK4736193.1 hypothetical protein [Noviherbaspirillum pedocola]
MSISALSTSSAYQSPSSTTNQGSSRGSAMKSLVDSINSGDLTSAKAAFDALQKNKPGSSTSASTATSSTTSATGTSQRVQDMAAIGQALQSGDADAAKQALAKLQQDHKAAEANGPTHGAQGTQHVQGGHHHHGHKTESAESSTSSSSTQDEMATYSASASTTQTSTTGSTINVSV